jgi:hypothetical protein
MTAAAGEARGPRRQRRALLDAAPRKPSRRSSRRGLPAGRFHAVCAERRELFIFGVADGTPFYREFRPGDEARHGQGLGATGTVRQFSGSFVWLDDPATGEAHRLDLYQFIRLNCGRDGGGAP